MSSYEKARIKLLDKNTGAVLKEVDPFTSADAVTCNDTETVQKKVDDFIAGINKNTVDIANLIANYDNEILNITEKDHVQDDKLTSIENKNQDQDNFISILQQSVNTHDTDISNLKVKNSAQDSVLLDLENEVTNSITLITSIQTKNIEQDELITSIQTKNSEQDVKLTTIQNNISTLQSGTPSKTFVRSVDPGSSAVTNDIWLDTANNVFKYKLSTGVWKIIGAAYN